MKEFLEKKRKLIFRLVILATFLCVFAYNFLTPYLSDDLFYLNNIRDAKGIGDLVNLTLKEYFNNGGRLMAYITFRIFFFIKTKQVYNIAASIMFTLLGILIYLNIKKNRKYDFGLIMLIYLLLWLSTVSFGETVLWITGACVHLFGLIWIFGCITLYRHYLSKVESEKKILYAVTMFLIALPAGNSSENNTAAGILLFVFITINYLMDKKAEGLSVLKSIRPFQITGFLGFLIGYGLLVLSPGTHNRAQNMTDGDYTGIVGMLSHFYKISVRLRDLILPLIVGILLLFVLLSVRGYYKKFADVRNHNAVLFTVAALASAYVLIVVTLTEDRVFFGTSVFFIVAFVQLVCDVGIKEINDRFIRYGVINFLCLMFFFTYLENLVNLARIYREENERISIIEENIAQGNNEYIVVPQYRPEFENIYSTAHRNDMEEDPGYWINTFYEDRYGVIQISAVPRDEWDENH